MKSTLSVILPCYNHGEFVAQAIEAVLNQSRLPDEFIIVDDASTDDSAAIIDRYARRHSFIQFERHPTNQGVVKALATLMARVTGDCVYAGASDDYILPGFIEQSMGMLEANPEAGICSGLCLVVNRQGATEGLFPCGVPVTRPTYLSPDQVRRKLCRYGGWFMGNTTINRRIPLFAAGGYRADLGPFADGFVSHVLSAKHGACYIPKPLAAWRRMDSGYATSTAANPAKMNAILERAEYLMTQDPQFAGLLPEAYLRDWKRRQHYWTGAARIQRQRAAAPPGRQRAAAVQANAALLALQFRCATWPATPLLYRWIWRHLAVRLRGS